MAKSKKNFMGWLGRQVGYVKKAVVTPVPEVVYRKEEVKEARVEGTSDHVMRRTTVDEVVVKPNEQQRAG